VRKHGISKGLGKRLEQVEGLSGDDLGELLGKDSVVEGVGDVVRPSRRGRLQSDIEIDLEGLLDGTFGVADAMTAEDAEPSQLDEVTQGVLGAQEDRDSGLGSLCDTLTTLCALSTVLVAPWDRGGSGLVLHAKDICGLGGELPPARPELTTRQPLDDSHCLRTCGEPTGPEQIPRHHTDDAVPKLVLMQEDTLTLGKPFVELKEEVRKVLPGIPTGWDGEVCGGDGTLLVGLEVVRGGEHRDNPSESLHAEPDDLLLAADTAVVRREAAGTLAHGQLILDDPGEIPRRDPCRPLTPHRIPPGSAPTAITSIVSSRMFLAS
jgi:hypothetical protein